MHNSSDYPNYIWTENLYMPVIEHFLSVYQFPFAVKYDRLDNYFKKMYISSEKDNSKGKTICPRLNSIHIHPK